MRKFLVTLLLLPLFIGGCLKHIPYDPALVESFHQRAENLRLDFLTEKGQQTAFYIPPHNDARKPPARIAILYPGIEAVALGWLKFISPAEHPDTAYLLIDYPGRGYSEGMMRPEKNYRNTEEALKKLAEHFGQETIQAKISLMGHSFGTGAALQFASRQQVERVVLVAPFNTLRRAVAVKSLMLSVLMPSQIDNRKLIRSILAAKNPPQITILHGTRDISLPATMGRELAGLSDQIIFHEFPEDDHVNILHRRRELIFNSLAAPGS